MLETKLKYRVVRKGENGATHTHLMAEKEVIETTEVMLDREELLARKEVLLKELDTIEDALATIDEFENENEEALLREKVEMGKELEKGKVNQALLEQMLKEKAEAEEKRMREEQLLAPENQNPQKELNAPIKEVPIEELPLNQDHQVIKNAKKDEEGE